MKNTENNIDLSLKINSAISHCTPDVLNTVLSRCTEQEGSITDMTTTNPKSKIIKAVIASAAALILIVGSVLGLGYYGSNLKVDSKVGIDVNPSISLDINRNEKIVSAKALNADAEKVLSGMDLRGSDIEVATNAIVGSMLQNGYISDLQNSMLISVDNADAEKGKALEEKLMRTVNSVLESCSVNASLIGQTVSVTDELSELSERYEISIGMAKLIKEIIDNNPNYTFESLAGLSVNELNLLLSSPKVTVDDVTKQGDASTKSYIEQDRALEIALQHAGLSRNQITGLDIEFDCEDGVMVYEVEFDCSGDEYEYDIDAVSGDIIKWEKERGDEKQSGSNSSAPQTTEPDAQMISADKAKSVALGHAGVSASDVTGLKCRTDRENGKLVYEVEFKYNGYEYDYDVDAYTADIVKYDKERDDDAPASSKPQSSKPQSSKPQSSKPQSSAPQTTEPDAQMISADKAKSVALGHAGVSASDVTGLKCRTDRENGRLVFEVDFKYNGYEYEYDIDAYSASIVKSDKERA